MTIWAEALDSADRDGHAAGMIRELSRTRLETAAEFEAMQLPGYTKHTKLPFTKFAQDPEAVLESLGAEKYWFQVLPTDGNRTNRLTVTENGIDNQAAVKKVLDYVGGLGIANTVEVFVCEFEDNRYGGNISVNRRGELYTEFGPGLHIQYSAGEETPSYFATKKMGETVKYSFEDIELRTAIWNTIRAVPHSDGEFYPGYYEYGLVGDHLRPIFFDYRSSPVFQLGERDVPMNL